MHDELDVRIRGGNNCREGYEGDIAIAKGILIEGRNIDVVLRERGVESLDLGRVVQRNGASWVGSDCSYIFCTRVVVYNIDSLHILLIVR